MTIIKKWRKYNKIIALIYLYIVSLPYGSSDSFLYAQIQR
jgi:hypothetical protein